MKNFIALLVAFVFGINVVNCQDFWKKMSVEELSGTEMPERSFPEIESSIYHLDFEILKEYLREAPKEFSGEKGIRVQIPLPDGTSDVFEVFESPVMAQGLADKFPAIKTYSGLAKDGKQVSMGYSPRGFFAVIKEMYWTYQIDNYNESNQSYYVVYDQMLLPDEEFLNLPCGLCEGHMGEQQITDLLYMNDSNRSNDPVEVITFRLGIATTGEFSARFGGTKESVLEELVRHVVNLNMIFINELSTRFELIATQDRLINLDSLTDDLTNGVNDALLGEAPKAFSSNGVFPEDFDIGHVFGTGGGGVAFLYSLCTSNSNAGIFRKAQGVSSHSGGSTITTGFLKLVAHEMGHQFGANHSFNNCQEDGNENGNTGFEPGSGNTIMSYNGICGSDNTEIDLLTNYNFGALLEMYTNITEGQASNCGTRISIGNTRPEAQIEYEGDFYIPISTPFKLTGGGSDLESDESELTYSWEQANNGMRASLGMPNPQSPLFRVYRPEASSTRYFPKLTKVLTNSFNNSELLPEVSRNFDFRLVVRDNHPGGGAFNTALLKFKATAEAGPFRFITQTSGKSYEVGEEVILEWDVANTDKAPINCKTVNIGILVGGNEFIPLAENVYNGGSFKLEIPDMEGFNYRFYIEAADNIFYNITRGNFIINPTAEPRLSIVPVEHFKEVCTPGEIDLAFDVASIGGFSDEASLTYIGGLPDGSIVSFDKNTISGDDTFTAKIQISDLQFTGVVEMIIEAAVEDGDTLRRSVILDILSTDYENLVEVAPVDGSTSVAISPLLSWTNIDNADSYYLTLNSLSGNFEEISFNIQDTSFQVTDILPVSTAFIWSVGVLNRCTNDRFVKNFSFNTINVNCSKFVATDLPLFMSQNMPSVRESTINVSDNFEVVDVNITNFRGNQNDMSRLTAEVISPQGNSVLLFSNPCITAGWNATFDEQSATPAFCQFVNGITRRPLGKLSDFNGQNAQGEWKVKFTNDIVGSSAQIREIELEICGDVNLSLPSLVRNEVLQVPTLQHQTISTTYLDIIDSDSGNDEVFVSLIDVPQKGRISVYGGSALQLGDSFTLSALKDFGVVYFHEGNVSDTSDFFRFVIRDKDGGFIGTFNFDIEISEEFVVSTQEINSKFDLKVFPNPSTGLTSLEYSDFTSDSRIMILNAEGRLLRSINSENINADRIELDLTGYSAGMYFIELEDKQDVKVAKLIIQ